MTKTTEELKREMYEMLKEVKGDFEARFRIIKFPSLEEFESLMEEYLERLRQEAIALQMKNDTQRSIIEGAGGTNDLSYRLIKMTDERDTLRNKLQAFEFANRSAAELLSEALREPSGLRSSQCCMVHQNRKEEPPCATCGGSTVVWMMSDKVDYPHRGNCPACTFKVVL